MTCEPGKATPNEGPQPPKEFDPLLVATWASTLAAFLSLMTSVMLVHLAARQERATLDSILYSKQVDLIPAFMSKLNTLIFAYTPGFLIHEDDKAVDQGQVEKYKKEVASIRLLTDELRQRAEELSFLTPLPAQASSRDLAERLSRASNQHRLILDETNYYIASPQRLLEFSKSAEKTSRDISAIHGDLWNCFQKDLLANGNPLTPESIVKCKFNFKE